MITNPFPFSYLNQLNFSVDEFFKEFLTIFENFHSYSTESRIALSKISDQELVNLISQYETQYLLTIKSLTKIYTILYRCHSQDIEYINSLFLPKGSLSFSEKPYFNREKTEYKKLVSKLRELRKNRNLIMLLSLHDPILFSPFLPYSGNFQITEQYHNEILKLLLRLLKYWKKFTKSTFFSKLSEIRRERDLFYKTSFWILKRKKYDLSELRKVKNQNFSIKKLMSLNDQEIQIRDIRSDGLLPLSDRII
ncbi:MAG: hypothetical protein QXD62_03635 [Candidatus Woesearchaeota archaeon]